MLQLIASEFPFGGSYVSDPMHVQIGGRVQLRLARTLAMSSLSVR